MHAHLCLFLYFNWKHWGLISVNYTYCRVLLSILQHLGQKITSDNKMTMQYRQNVAKYTEPCRLQRSLKKCIYCLGLVPTFFKQFFLKNEIVSCFFYTSRRTFWKIQVAFLNASSTYPDGHPYSLAAAFVLVVNPANTQSHSCPRVALRLFLFSAQHPPPLPPYLALQWRQWRFGMRGRGGG